MSALFRRFLGFMNPPPPQPVLGLPAAGVPAPALPPPPRPSIPWPPVVEWQSAEELVAWRAWRLLTVMSPSGPEIGLRLVSISVPRIWMGPVAQTDPPTVESETPSGIHVLKEAIWRQCRWSFLEDCWVSGTVALSGRVIEHAAGYRAERAVIRDLRLSVGTHLAVRSLEELSRLIGSLEQRYQVAVDVGQAEREAADKMLTKGTTPKFPRTPWVKLVPPWALI
ncbi:MAG: hypothetical protein Q8R92_18995 [Deltaproteobacteria bacterium]|nr:hypothetical protein [Deltaproteobacteria bacterium]